jgi:hypothetical protein
MVIQAAGYMAIEKYKQHRRAVGVEIAKKPTNRNLSHDSLDAIEGDLDIWRIVHRQQYPSSYLDY